MTQRLLSLLVLINLLPALAQARTPTRQQSPTGGRLVINEILYDWREGELEFVELYNASGQSFFTDELWIADSRNLPVRISTRREILASRSYLIISRDSAGFTSTFDISSVTPESWPILNNTGDTVYLYWEDIVMDSVQYDDSWGGDGVSLERRTWYGPSSTRSNWGSCRDPAGATPGRANSLYTQDDWPPVLLFLEEQLDNRVELFFDEPVALTSLNDLRIEIAGQHPVSIEPSSDTSLVCLFRNAVPDGKLRLSGLRDLAGNVLDTSGVAVARLAFPGELVVNEVLYQPRTDHFDGLPDQMEYVEFFSRADRLLTLRNASWTGEPDEKGNTLDFSLGSGKVIIEPGGFLLVYAAGGNAVLHDAFPDLDFDRADLILVPVNRSSLNLRDTGDAVRLFRADGLLLDEVWYTPGLHNSALVDPAGVSLERIDPDAPSQAGTTWGSCPFPSGGTPGARNGLYLSTPDQPAGASVTVIPEIFSPDSDGLDDFVTIGYSLSENVSSVRLRIFDSSGRLVRTVLPDFIGGHEGRLVWDGYDEEGQALRIGIYIVYFEAVSTETGLTETCTRSVVLARPLH